MKNYHFFFLSLFLFSSCIYVNENGYRLQKKALLDHKIRPFDENNKDTSFHLVEITAHQLLTKLMPQDEKVWIRLWRPWCKGPTCYSPSTYEKMAKEKGVKLYLLSEDYDLASIQQICKQSNYSAPFVYALSGAYYGTGRDKTRKKFLQELLQTDILTDSLRYSSNFVFTKGKLTYCGNDYEAF